jgi:hypothetical protein
MKNNQNQRNFSSIKNKSNSSFKRILKHFYGIKEYFSFDIFQYLKADHKKLQIIYANIRVWIRSLIYYLINLKHTKSNEY